MGNKNGHVRSIDRIERVLKENNGLLSSSEIYDKLLLQKKLNSDRTYTNTITINQLTNLLSKNIQFKKHDDVNDASIYSAPLWELDKREKNEEDATVS